MSEALRASQECHFYSGWWSREKYVGMNSTVTLPWPPRPPNNTEHVCNNTSFTDYTVRMSVIKSQPWFHRALSVDEQHMLALRFALFFSPSVPAFPCAMDSQFPISAPATASECTKGAEYYSSPSLYLKEHISLSFYDAARWHALSLLFLKMNNSFWRQS